MPPLASLARKQLRLGPRTTRQLMAALNVSRSTLRRTLQALDDQVIKVGAARSVKYALRDPARADGEADVFRITSAGVLQELGTLVPVCPKDFQLIGASAPHADMNTGCGHRSGLPWWLIDLRPQGYLGRSFNLRHGAQLGWPERLSDWGDFQIMRALLIAGGDLPGNLLIGRAAREQVLNGAPLAPIAHADIPQAYADLAQAAARGHLHGFAAAGEQAKFTAYVQREDGSAKHVLVKFSSAVVSPVSARWRDLLLAEHLALAVLLDAGIPAARSRLVDHGQQRFLEVERFDRIEARGRCGLHSLAALDARFAGTGGSWPQIVRSLLCRKVVAPDALPITELLWAFGTLIGNTDMHNGNLSFLSEDGQHYKLAPAYDMTPMVFAPSAGGDLPIRNLEPNVGTQVPELAWRKALPLATEFVRRLRTSPGFCGEFESCLAMLSGYVGLAQERIECLAAETSGHRARIQTLVDSQSSACNTL